MVFNGIMTMQYHDSSSKTMLVNINSTILFTWEKSLGIHSLVLIFLIEKY